MACDLHQLGLQKLKLCQHDGTPLLEKAPLILLQTPAVIAIDSKQAPGNDHHSNGSAYNLHPSCCKHATEQCLQVLAFYQHLGMPLPEVPPLMLVETSALDAAESKEGRGSSHHGHGPVFHTRGLTLTAE